MKKLLKFFSLICLGLLTSFVVGYILLHSVLKTESAQTWLFHRFSSLLQSQTTIEVKWKSLSFSFPFDVHIEELSLSQKGQPIAHIKDTLVSFRYPPLWKGEWTCSSFKMDQVDLFANPFNSSPTETMTHSPPLASFLPFDVTCERIDIQHLHFHLPLVETLSLPPESIAKLTQSEWDVKGKISNHVVQFVLSIPTEPLSFSVDIQNDQLTASGHLDPFLLHEFFSFFSSDLNGHLNFYASGTIDAWSHLLQKHSSFESFIEGHLELFFEPPHSFSYFSTPAVLTTDYRFASLENIEFSNTQLTSSLFSLSGEYQINAQQDSCQGTFKGKISLPFQKTDLSVLSLEGNIQGAWSSPSLALTLKLPFFEMKEEKIKDFTAVCAFSIEKNQLFGSCSYDCDYRQRSWKGTSFFDWNLSSSLLSFSDIKIKSPSVDIEGKFLYSFQEKEAKGNLRVHLEDLKEFSSLFPSFPLEGNACLDLILEPSEEGNLPRLWGRLISPSLKTGEWEIKELKWEGDLPLGRKTSFTLAGKGFFKEAWDIVAEGEWAWEGQRYECEVKQLKGTWGTYPLILENPFYFIKEEEGKQSASLNLIWGKALLQGEFKQQGEQISSQFKTNDISSELFQFLTPDLPLSGKATFSGRLSGTWDHPEGELMVQLHRIQIMEESFAQKPFIEGTIHFHLDQGTKVNLYSQLYGIGENPIKIAGTLPWRMPFAPTLLQKDSFPFHLSIQAEGLIDPYVRLFYEEIKTLSGETKISLELSGEMKAPKITGKVVIWNGVYESLTTGAFYHHIEATLEGRGSEIVLTHCSAQDRTGLLKASGTIQLDWRRHFPFTFSIQSSNILAVDSDYAVLSANGPLTLTGDLKHAKLQGVLSIDRAEIDLGESLPNSVKTIDVQYINLPKGEHLASNKNKHSALEFDLKLHADHVVIQGKQLSSKWKGEIQVTGTPKNPLMFGELRLVKGEYNLNGKALTLSQGSIHFFGDPRKKTTLYVVASKEIDPMFSEALYQEDYDPARSSKSIDHIYAEIILKGPINRPKISFRSTPPLSQREVLSYILFNRGISDITANQGDLLAQSFISLNSSEKKSDSDDFLSRIRNNIGVDRLDLITGDKWNPDLGLQIGKYLTPNVLVSLNHSMNTLTPVVAIEAKLKKHLKAQAESGLGGDNHPVRFSLKWKKDY